MKLSKKITAGLMLSASALALAGCSTGTIDDAVEKFDSVQSGDIEMVYEVDSETYGEYRVDLKGQFELIEDNKEQANASGLIKKVNATELDGEEESDESGEQEPEIQLINATITEEDLEEMDVSNLTEEEVEQLKRQLNGDNGEGDELQEEDPSRIYNYSVVEENRMYVDGQETTSTGEIIALDDTLYDKVFLTGSEADGRFVYDSRDVGIVEYPMASYLTVSPIIEAFDLDNSDIEVKSGNLHNGDKGQVFTATTEEVVTALQGAEETSALTQNILGLVTEANVDKVIIGVNATTFSVEAISTGASDNDDTPTSEAETDSSEDKTTEEKVVGSLVVTKTAGKVEIETPKNAMDLDEFSSLVELYYQQQAEQSLEGQLSDEEVYGDGEPVTNDDSDEQEDSSSDSDEPVSDEQEESSSEESSSEESSSDSDE